MPYIIIPLLHNNEMKFKESISNEWLLKKEGYIKFILWLTAPRYCLYPSTPIARKRMIKCEMNMPLYRHTAIPPSSVNHTTLHINK